MVATRSMEAAQRRDGSYIDRPNLVKMATLPAQISGRIRLPKELTAIRSASTLPACRLDPNGE
jgi:hypothetical protein